MPTQKRLRELLAEELDKVKSNDKAIYRAMCDKAPEVAWRIAALAAMSRAVQEAYEEAIYACSVVRAEYTDEDDYITHETDCGIEGVDLCIDAIRALSTGYLAK